MSTDMVTKQTALVSAAEFETTKEIAEVLVKSGFFKDVRDVAQGIAKILAGRELGFAPIASLNGIYLQQGRISYTANLMAAAIKRSGRYNYRVLSLDEKGCELEVYEYGKAVGKSSFTLNDAAKANLTTGPNKHNYAAYPRNMFFARAISNVAKWHCADIFGGVTPYLPEELGAVVDGESGEVVDTPSEAPAEEPSVDETLTINNDQRKKLFGVLKSAHVEHEDFKAWLVFHLQIDSTSKILQRDFGDILDAIRKGEIAEWVTLEDESLDAKEPE